LNVEKIRSSTSDNNRTHQCDATMAMTVRNAWKVMKEYSSLGMSLACAVNARL
jgi:hypothetical protein